MQGLPGFFYGCVAISKIGPLKWLTTLHRTYHDPMGLADSMISCGEFSSFVADSVRESNERLMWEVWLNKCYGVTWGDFKESARAEGEKEKLRESADVGGIIRMSLDISEGVMGK